MTEPVLISESPAAVRASQLNAQTRVLQTYESHRQQTMALITAAMACETAASTESERTISILGAGNCLDLDLAQVTRCFRVVNLLDLDPAALEFGMSHQNGMDRDRIRLHAPVDLAAPLAVLTSGNLVDHEFVDSACAKLSGPFETMPCSEADVVVSTCVLSQMIGAITNVCSEQHPHFLRLLQSVRRGHFCRLLQLLRPGGRGVFISDLVSSESIPSLRETASSALPGLLAQCLASGNFFSGLNPGVVLQDLKVCEAIGDVCCDVQIHSPWRWQMGPRIYAVYAVSFGRKRV